MGHCYIHGQGVVKNFSEALKWLRKAVEKNDSFAQSNLGYCYETGQGVAKDEVEAVKYYRKAANQNRASAQFNLGLSYVKGQGIEKNDIEAYKWWLLAKAQGDEDAAKYLLVLEREMSSDQIAKSQELARNFKPQLTLEPGEGDLIKPDKY